MSHGKHFAASTLAHRLMNPPATQNSNQANSGRIWECINADAKTTFGSPEDDFVLDDVVGIDFCRKATSNQSPWEGDRWTTQRNLVQGDVNDWLKQQKGSTLQNGGISCGKLLVGNQIVQDDFLRPPQAAGGVKLSRQTLAQCFCLPSLLIAGISSRAGWNLSSSGPPSGPPAAWEGLGTSTFSLAMSFDEVERTVYAILVFHPSIRQEAKDILLREAEVLGHLSGESAWVPYLVMHLCRRISSGLLKIYSEQAHQTDLHLQRFAQQRQIDSIFGQTHGRSSSASGILQDGRNVLKMSKKWTGLIMKKPSALSQADWARLEAQRVELRTGLGYCTEELKVIVESASQIQQQIARQLTTALSMMAYEQQKLSRRDQQTSIDIAEASKTIAEESKKDGYSMKTLAVVTMLFLPATSVSSILAMPLFRWDEGDEDSVVNRKLWVYFVLAIPLTALTVGLWWLWQKRVIRGSPKTASSC